MGIKSSIIWGLISPFFLSCSDASMRGSFGGSNKNSGDTPSANANQVFTEPTPALSGAFAIDPALAIIFRGETVTYTATLNSEGTTSDVTADTTWTTADKTVVALSNNVAKGLEGGDAPILASFNGTTAEAKVSVIQCRAGIGSGTPATKIQVKGENWPDNTVDDGGADHDDYFVTITGRFAIENNWEIFATEDQEIDVKFQLGSTGDTSQTVRLSSVDCDGNDVTEQAITQTSGSTKISVKKGDRFNLHTRAVTFGDIRNFDLLGDKGYAYRLHIIE